MLSGGNLYQSFGLPGAAPIRRNVINEKPSESEGDSSGGMGFGMTEKEIDERVISLVSISILMLISFFQISKAVEAEVARRLAERERERLAEELRSKEIEHEASMNPPLKEKTLPPGVLTPLLKRHKDLDDELKNRLHELERKLYVIFGLSFCSIADADPVRQ